MKTEEDEAFEAIERKQGGFQAKRAMAADKLQEPAQEPMATLEQLEQELNLEQEIYKNTQEFVSHNVIKWMLKRYYTAPPQREWVGLTDEDKQKLAAAQFGWEDLCLAVEAKLKEKNT